jgi:NitT/TauT family transport system substrate-binding protein
MECCLVTPNVRKDGFGDVDKARLKRGIDILVHGFELPSTPSTDAIFNSSYLPQQKDRMVK